MVNTAASQASITANSLVFEVDALRCEATAQLDSDRRAAMGQVMTPPPVAELMASMFSIDRPKVRLLDPGAGMGSLTAASIAAMLTREARPKEIEVVAYEIEPLLVPHLNQTLDLCRVACDAEGVRFRGEVVSENFLSAAEREANNDGGTRFNCTILNPPYRKINSNSEARRLARALGLEVSNLYAAFVGAAVCLLEPGAEIVAITPRSFANGPYFRPFRSFLLDRIAFRRLHLFDSRTHAFRSDDVLQENVIVHGVRDGARPESVEITASATPNDPVRSRFVPGGRVVYAHDPEQFIHLIVDEEGDAVAETMAAFDNYLQDLAIAVSTGPVVDFRSTDALREMPGEGTVPLLYPGHLNGGTVHWPRDRVKANALALTEKTRALTVPRGNYVLVKRFTSKEERRRVVAAVYEESNIETDRVAFENHLNFFHVDGAGLSLDLARGLSIYLNSTLVDTFFRQFSGHTQVNAADLRNMPYPPRDRLEATGNAHGSSAFEQDEIDRAVERVLLA